MRPGRFWVVAVVVAVAAVGGGWAVGKFRQRPAAPPADPPVSAGRGVVLYQVHCAGCHGPDGRGDGPAAAALRPPPRDLAARPWRGEVGPEHVRRVILDGLPGTPMPAFKQAVSSGELDALAAHTLDLARRAPAATDADADLLRAAGLADLRGATPPPLTVTDAGGSDTTLSSLKGKLVLLHFWGTGCVHCLKEMPALKRLEAELAPRGFAVLHVCADADDAAEAQKVVDAVAPGVRTHAELTGLGLARFEAGVLPTVWLIAADGTALGRVTGAHGWTTGPPRQVLERWLPRP